MRRERGEQEMREGGGKEAGQLKCFPEAYGLTHIPSCQEVKCDGCKQVTACVHQSADNLSRVTSHPSLPMPAGWGCF